LSYKYSNYGIVRESTTNHMHMEDYSCAHG